MGRRGNRLSGEKKRKRVRLVYWEQVARGGWGSWPSDLATDGCDGERGWDYFLLGYLSLDATQLLLSTILKIRNCGFSEVNLAS
jgi:hypothetical protein